MSLKSESGINICLDQEQISPNIYINESHFVVPNENITREQINNVFFISMRFHFSEPTPNTNVGWTINQLVVLSQDLEVILIIVHGFSRSVI